MQLSPDGRPEEPAGEEQDGPPPAPIPASTLEWASFPGSSGLAEFLGGTDAYMRLIRPGYGNPGYDDDDDGPPAPA